MKITDLTAWHKRFNVLFCFFPSIFFFPISHSAFHMLLWVSALSRTFSQQFRMQVDNGGKEVVRKLEMKSGKKDKEKTNMEIKKK